MPAFMITYDLQAPDKNYPKLSEAIKKNYPRHWNMLGSVWMINFDGKTSQIRDTLKNYIDSNDNLIVVALTGESSWTGPKLIEHADWLKKTLNG